MKQLKQKIMREIKISFDTAIRWYNGTDKELKGLALQTYPELEKKELPKNWEELGKITGFFTKYDSTIDCSKKILTRESNRNVFATKEQAEASIALAQLSQLREVYRKGWVPDCSDDANTNTFCIEFYENKIYKENYVSRNRFLSFQDPETRDLFLYNFWDLIEQAKPLFI